MKQVKRAVGTPVNKHFIRKAILYAIILFVMVLIVPKALEQWLDPMIYDGFIGGWYTLYIPVAVAVALFGLYRENRRRWGWGFVQKFYQGYCNGNYTCPRCGAPIQRFTEKYQKKVYDYSRTEGNTTINYYHLEDGYITYYRCSGAGCCLRVRDPQYMSAANIPWKKKELRSLVLNDRGGFKKDRHSAYKMLEERFIFTRMLPLALVLILGVYAAYSYIDGQSGAWSHLKASKEVDRDGAAYQSYLLTLDNEAEAWTIHYTKKSTDFFGSFVGSELEGYRLGSGKLEGVAYTTYDFNGNDLDTGLPNGEYRLTTVDGVAVLADVDEKILYKSDTEFYKTYAPKLRAITHDTLMQELQVQTKEGEHGLDYTTEFVRGQDTTIYSYMLPDDPTKVDHVVEVTVNHPKELQRDQYRFDYKATPYQPDYTEFTYFEAK